MSDPAMHLPILQRGPAALAAALLAFAAVPLPAQETRPADASAPQGPDQAQLQKLRAEKLAKPVFLLLPWRTDFDAARREAKERGALLLTYFTRSYAF